MSRKSAPNLRDILNPILLLQHGADLVWQLAEDLVGVGAADVAVEAVVFGYPGLGRVGDGDEALEDGRGAGLDLLAGALEVEELFAVGAAFVSETLMGHDYAADHAGAKVALLAGGDVVFGHFG